MPKGLNADQWNKHLRSEFRGGFLTLTEDLFPNYRDGGLAKVATTDMLRNEFFNEDNG